MTPSGATSTNPTMTSHITPFLEHIHACNQATLPGQRAPFFWRDEQIGWVSPAIARELRSLKANTGNTLGIQDTNALRPLALTLAQRGLYKLHHEDFDIRNKAGDIIGQIDRGAIPILGLAAEGIHLNGLVETNHGPHLWVARRSMDKKLDPGKLDHLVAGGMSAGLTPSTTVIKEAEEEAGIPPSLAQQAKPVSRIQYAMERPEGLRRDVLHCYDLTLPETFRPIPNDGEVESFHLLPLMEVFERVRSTHDFKFNVNLVLIDLFLRRGLFSPQDHTLIHNALHPIAS
ncbi:NUDIX hydrolase [Neokomagataea thailandica]|nr:MULTISPECIES: NUDIX domain-containing protein [Neokomagataea]